MTLEELELHLRDEIDEDAIAVEFRDGGGFGVVRWYRPFNLEIEEHVVHRWAAVYTDGSPVKDGCTFYDGGYYIDNEMQAVEDYQKRVLR